MTNRRVLTKTSSLRRRRANQTKESRARRNLQLEFLEARQLLAVGPRLMSIEPNVGDSIEQNDLLRQSPRELRLAFDTTDVIDEATAQQGGVQFISSGGDGTFGDGNEVTINPAFIGLGISPSDVLIRFANSLPDDTYRLQVVGSGSNPLTNVAGDPFNNGVDFAVDFQLDQGARVLSVVPQPVTRNPNTGKLSQALDKIDVYFNDDMDLTSAQDPAFYQLQDKTTGDIRLPVSVAYNGANKMATLTFSGNLPASNFHLQIGRHEEVNDSISTATNVGTISQEAPFAVYETPITLDTNGNPITTPIPDLGTIVSSIAVDRDILVRDINVQVDLDHEAGEDLRIFLVSPSGNRVELVRDLGSDTLQGQIYGVKFYDLDGDGTQDANEPGLPGVTIYLDINSNGELDAFERSTVTDSEGRFAFVGLTRGRDYQVAEVPQPFFQQTSFTTGATQVLYSQDFSNGGLQYVDIIPDATTGLPDSGYLILFYDGSPISQLPVFTGINSETADAIEASLQQEVDPGITVDVTVSATTANRFEIRFLHTGVNTPFDAPILQVSSIALNRGSAQINTVADAGGFVSSGPANEWHLSTARGNNTGHSGQDSFYFGSNEVLPNGGQYANNANGTLVSPEIDLSDPTIVGDISLQYRYFLNSELDFDFATAYVRTSEGALIQFLSVSGSSGGWVTSTVDLTPYRGQIVQLEFQFTSDGSVLGEGFYVDDIRVTTPRGIATVSLGTGAQQGVEKNLELGGFRPAFTNPNGSGYQARVVGTDFEDISTTGTRVLQEFVGQGFAKRLGGTSSEQSNAIGRDAAGNLYVSGIFQGTVDFDPSAAVAQLTSNGVNDVFVAKYDASGNFVWVTRFGGTGAENATAIKVDALGNSYVTGSFSGTVAFGGNSLTSNGSTDVFVTKLDNAGNVVWARAAGGAQLDEGAGIALDGSGNVFVTGQFAGTVSFGGTALTSVGGSDTFVWQLNNAGTSQSAFAIGGTGTDRGRAIAVDSDGNVTIAGAFSGTIDFNLAPGAGNVANQTSAGSTDGFVVQYAPNGTFRWVNRIGGVNPDEIKSIAVDSNDNVIVTGASNDDIVVVKYNQAGAQQWLQQLGGAAADSGESIVVDTLGRAYVTGSFRGTFNGLTSKGGTDIFLLRLTAAGATDILVSMGGTADDAGLGVAVDANNDFIHVGRFRSTVDFDLGPPNTVQSLTAVGSQDAYLATYATIRGIDDGAVLISATDLTDTTTGDSFSFEYFQAIYNELYVSTNGVITFAAPNASPDNGDLTTAPLQASILPFWEDLFTGSGANEAVFWEVRGTGDRQRLIIQWSNVRLDGVNAQGEPPLNFQVVLREIDGSIQFNYQTVSDVQFVADDEEFLGSFTFGTQDRPRIASDANGNYVVAWNSPGQDGSGLGVYARRYNAAGVAQGPEFLVNTTTTGDQRFASIDMNASGRFVVVWQDDSTNSIRAQIFNAAGVRVGNEFLVNPLGVGSTEDLTPQVAMEASGAFTVVYGNSAAENDNLGIVFRRFDLLGNPRDAVDEIQEVEFLGPPADSSTFTLFHDGQETATITYAGVNRGNLTAQNMQTALRNLPNLSNTLTVTAIDQDETQLIEITGSPTVGTFTLSYQGTPIVNAINFDATFAPAAIATQIETELRALANIDNALTVTAVSLTQYRVRFGGADRRIDLPLIQVTGNTLDGGGNVQVTELLRGSNPDLRFRVRFNGVDGGQDQPLVQLGNIFGGVTHLKVAATQEGTDGEVLVNSAISPDQADPAIGITPTGQFTILWESPGQDGSGLGVYGKRYDANAQPIPGDQNEIQRLQLLGTVNVGARYRLRHEGATTGNIIFTGFNLTDAARIQTAMNGIGRDVVVTPAAGNTAEVQAISFTSASGGSFRLAHAGQTTGLINFAGLGGANGLTTATNIQNALNALANTGTGITVVPAANNADRDFLVTFGGVDSGIDQPDMVLAQNNLNAGTVDIFEVNRGGASRVAFVVEFVNDDGERDRLPIELADNTGGVIDIQLDVITEGSGSEFLVPETTTGDQANPALAVNPTGGFVAVWESPDGDGTGIYARVFNASGAPVSAEFQANTITTGSQQFSDVVFLTSGDFIITWNGPGDDSAAAQEVWGRRFDASGFALGDEFLLSQSSVGNQTQPVIAAQPGGEYVVAFQSDFNGGGIHTQQFASNDGFQGSDTSVSNFGVLGMSAQAIDRNASGQYVVAWVDNRRDSDLSNGIYVQAFDANGNAVTAELAAAVNTDENQSVPMVSIDDAGNFVVLWRTPVTFPHPTIPNATIAGTQLHGRRFNANGTPASGEFVLNSQVQNSLDADVDITADGRFVVVWRRTSSAPLAVVNDLAFERFDASGNSLGTTTFAPTGHTSLGRTSVSVDPNGAFFVVGWDANIVASDNNTHRNVFNQIFDFNGNAITQPYVVSEVDTSLNAFVRTGIDGSGNITAVWRDLNQDVTVVRRFDSSGTPLTDEVTVVSPNFTSNIAVADDGSFAVTWGSGTQALVQRFTSTVDLLGNPVPVNETYNNLNGTPVIAVDGNNQYLVSWTDTRSTGGTQVGTRRFGSDFPSVGIRNAGVQQPGQDLLQIWIDGSRTPYVGSGISTRIERTIQIVEPIYAVSNAGTQILHLDDAGNTVGSVPTPVTSPGSAGLALLGNTLYFVADGGSTLYELDPATGAWVDTIDLATLSLNGQLTNLSGKISSLAVLNGQVVMQDSASGKLYFLDPFKNTLVGSITPSKKLTGGLVGGGDRGTLFGISDVGNIVEIQPDGSLVREHVNAGSPILGLALTQGVLLAARGSNVISRIDPDSGAILGTLTTATPVSSLGGDGGSGIAAAFDPILEPFDNTLFDDEASQRITLGEGPYTGSYRPVQPLSNFDGEQSLGNWRLEIQDALSGDVGELKQWRLFINDVEDTSADFSTQAFIGDRLGIGANDVDLYRVSFLEAGTVDVQVQPDTPLDAIIRLFNQNGFEIARTNAGGVGAMERLIASVPAAGTYFVGISSSGNGNYSATGAVPASGGTSTGRYELDVRFDKKFNYSDDNSSYATATNVGVLGDAGFRQVDQISSPSFTLRLPGGIDDPGHRDIPAETHLNGGTSGTVVTAPYNFRDIYGVLPSGDQAVNAITEEQKDRAREIFEIYGQMLGIQFYETNSQGLTVVTGDMRAISPDIPVGPGGVAGLSEGSLSGRVIMDAADFQGPSPFGGGWFTTAMHEIGHSLGLGHTYEQPAVTVMGTRPQGRFPDNGEPIYPGPVDVIHGQYLLPPSSRDLDLFRFEVLESGHLTAETFAERFKSGVSLLDTEIILYRETVRQGRVVRELVASNDDYFGDDSRIELHIEPGVYFLGVHSTGLVDIDPSISDSGFGGISTGRYEVELNFKADARSALTDASGAALDGDSDGAPGGVFDFWFQSGSTIFVDKLNSTTSGPDGDGSLANPFDNIGSALNVASARIVVPSGGAAALNAGELIVIAESDTSIQTFEFEFAPASGIANRITIDSDATDVEVAQAIANAINDPALNWNVTATASGAVVQLTGIAYRDLSGTPGLISSSNLVRIVGNGGADKNIATLGDNVAYKIGENNGVALEDGLNLNVPQGVTVMLDAGAILKMLASIVDVGSSSQNIDRSGAAIQLLGTPGAPVLLRSFRNDAIGGDDDGPSSGPEPGNWGGIVIRDDSDLEQDGIFLNWINFADMNNGGGKVVVDSVEQTFTPVHLFNSRPTISNTIIRGSADAAVSADPDSFEESIGRVGPDIHDNLIVNNSINGLFIRVRTDIGQPLDTLDVSARFDDTDIVHVLTENLVISGNPGGPDARSGQLVARSGARLAIDPGMIVKMEGARIEVSIGAQLIAEGTEGSEVIFTALKDDTYGAGGTSDTSNDQSGTQPAPGQWGGIYFGHASSGSLDHVLVQYAGGQSALEGSFDNFNPIEIHQAQVRIANSDLRNNASGRSSSDRNGRGFNDAAVIFVRGAQPILVNNQIFDNPNSKAITIDVNSLQAVKQADPGRQTGSLDAFTQFVGNYGPLVRLNRMQNNDINGMEVRGGVLKTEGVWDDVDTTHVVRDEIVVPNFHSLGGLRLQSSAAGSLVIKLAGANAGFTATGDPLDITDRIGGSLYVLGASDRPVVFTSLNDDSVAAGLDLSGLPQFDTNNDGDTNGAAGQWRSLRLEQYSNDRNVSIKLENERPSTGKVDVNSIPGTAEFLGQLAANDKNGDDDRRVGFTVIGTISLDDPADQDVYSFDAVPGTEIWIDIDRTSPALDVAVELIDANGFVLAKSLDNTTLSGLARSMNKDSVFGGDFYTTNARDAGMRLTLPAGSKSVETYYVRVRSERPGEKNPSVIEERSRGSYQLQIRLRQVDEISGSAIRNADIRFATNGIEVIGLPDHSNLTGESYESSAGNDSFGTAQRLGNLLVSERSTISVGGNLSAANDIDWYQFELDIDQIQSIGGVNDGGKTWSTIFDIDYADGLARPDTVLAIFDENGIPILVSRDSNVLDDQPRPGQGADTESLLRGSFGTLDPFIGSVQMPTGIVPAGVSKTYFVAVSSNGQLPSALSGTFNAGSGSALVRLEPVNSVQRIAEDHIGFSGHTTGTDAGSVTVNPLQTLFDIGTATELSTHVLEYTLNEMVLYLGSGSNLTMVNPFTGEVIAQVGGLNNQTSDLAMRTDGRLYGVRSLNGTANTAGELVSIDPATAAQTSVGNDAIPDFNPATNPPDIQQLTSDTVNAMAIARTGFNTQNNAPVYEAYYAVQGYRIGGGQVNSGSTLYRVNPASGSAAPAQNQPWGRVGVISTSITPTGMAFVGGQLYGVDAGGQLFTISTGSGAANVIANLGFNFQGLSAGPVNLQGGAFANLLFGVTGNGTLVAFDTNGNLQGVFAGGASSITTGVTATGLAFSPLDFNMWHPTLQRRDDAGHGINTAFDLSRTTPADFARPNNTDEAEGGVSFYFGFEDFPVANDQESYLTYGGGQYGVLSSDTQRDLATNTAFNNNYNLPGGALGSLATNTFSLAGYTSPDKPTLYFNYFLNTQNANATASDMRDSFRVQLSTNGGTTWQMLATNNSLLNEELPEFLSTSANASFDSRQRVQELFDNTNGWRQARVDLSQFAGSSNIQIRFDFSTAGTMDQGVPGDAYGNANHVERARNNAFEGAYIDDIIIGFAERGEMVTNTTPTTQTGFFAVPRVATAPQEVLQGLYQLEIRRGTEYGFNVTSADPEIVVGTQFDTNDRMILGEGIDRLGDQNSTREQGRVAIEQNTISDALQFGIVIDSGVRDDGNLAHPGSVRNLPTVNVNRLVPGVTVVNNVISGLGTGGILFSGDPNTGAVPVSSVPYGRILNNTIYGGENPAGVGIQVTENASPTMLNNIIANTATAISIDGTSGSTIVGATLLQGNNARGNFTDSNLITLQVTDPLFVDAANRNFYLERGAIAIDSSINTLVDRQSIVEVKSALGISPSPIAAPDLDRFGQLRIDDPSQDPPPGLGSNIFKDRGAIERSDFVGPFVQLLSPQDNDAAGVDLNPLATEVLVDIPVLSEIRILVTDNGIGVDENSISADAITLTFDGRVLTDGVDYQFVYFSNEKVISLRNLPDNVEGRSTYVITIDNTATGIVDLAGNLLANNQASGSTMFTIVSGVAPDAVDDTVSVDEDSFVFIDVLDNDIDVGSPLNPNLLVITSDPTNGVAEVINGEIRYEPVADYFGPDMLTYRVTDADGRISDTGTVFITVNPINDRPIGFNDPATGVIRYLEDDPTTPIAISWNLLLGNDLAGPPNESTQVLSVGNVAPLNGDPASQVPVVVTNDPTNRVVLVTPQVDKNGIAKFTYFVQDDQANFNTALAPATVTIQFLAVNDAPFTDANLHAARGYNVDEDPLELTPPTRLQIDVTEIEADDRPAPATATDELVSQKVQFVNVIATSENGGTVTYNPTTGLIEYVPAQDFFGTDHIFYTIADTNLDDSDPQSWVRNPDGTYSLVDDPRTSRGTIAVTVNPRNDPPRFARSLLEGLEDATTSYNDLINLFGIVGGPAGETDPVVISLSQNAIHGVATLNFDSQTGLYSLDYQPNADFFGTDTFLLTLTDVPPSPFTPLSVVMPVTVTVRPVNDAPVGTPNGINLIEGQSRTIPTSLLLGNDLVDGVVAGGTSETSAAAGNRPQQLRVRSIAFAPGTPSGGSIQISTDGKLVTIVPPPNYYSTDGSGNATAPDLKIVYTLEDNGISYQLPSNNLPSAPQEDPRTATATVTATVYPTNNPPIAKTHQVLGVVKEDTPFSISTSLLVPTDGLVDSLSVGAAIPANYDSAGIGEDLGPNGVKDAGETLYQHLSILSPVTGLSRISTTLGGTVEFQVNPATGKVENLLYTPPIDFASVPATLLDSFNYRLVDDGRSFLLDTNGNPVEIQNSQKTSVGRVEIQVQPLNDRPQFNTSSLVVNSQEDSGQNFIDRFAFNITAAPISAADEIAPVTGQKVAFTVNPLSFTAGNAAQFFEQLPTITPDGDLSFKPAADAFGNFLFEVILVDDGPDNPAQGHYNSSIPVTMTISVAPVNDPPTFVAGGPIDINEDSGPFNQAWASSISVGPANESTPPNEQTIAFEVVTPPASLGLFETGRAPSITEDGILRFTTAANANGTAVVQVTAVDSDGGRSQTVALTIVVREVNDPPVARPDKITTDEDTILTIPSSQLLENDIDPDLNTNPNERLTIVMPEQSFSISGASITFDPVTGVITYNPTTSSALQALAPGQSLVDSFAYSVMDKAGTQSNVVTVALTVAGINDAPKVQLDSPQLSLTGSTIIRVLDNDIDVDGFIVPSSLRVELPPAFGSAVVRTDGTIVYTPFGGSALEDVFTYTVADNLGLRSKAAFVTISTNASPIAVNDAKGTFLDESVSINVAANDRDPDGTLDLTSVQIVTAPLRGQAIPQADGTVQYVPIPGFLGRDSFQYQIADNLGRPSNIATVNVEVVASRLQNPDLNADVNDDGDISALDALLVINHLSRADGAVSIPVLPTDRGPYYYDVNGNKQITANDALIVINELARINNGSGIGRELVLPALQVQADPAPIVGSDPVAAPQDLSASDKIFDASQPIAVADDLVDLIATDRDGDSDESTIDALDAAFADLL